jgi:predicted DNA-binding protein (MmcQ/YjbR family)
MAKGSRSISRSIPKAVRELCLAFPEAEEFESHGSPNFRARKGKVFAVWALNHHGDGHVALWLNTPAMEQSRLIASSPQIYKPPYVGPSGWIGVELNRGFSWKRVIELVHMAYRNSSPAKLVARADRAPVVAAPTVKMKPEEIDRLKAPQALKMLALMRKLCLALPETDEGSSFGSPTWRVGKKVFANLCDYGNRGLGLTATFWVGIERQGPLEMDPRLSIPPYIGAKGWMALDVSKGANERELRDFLIESWRHFATRRAIKRLEAQAS